MLAAHQNYSICVGVLVILNNLPIDPTLQGQHSMDMMNLLTLHF